MFCKIDEIDVIEQIEENTSEFVNKSNILLVQYKWKMHEFLSVVDPHTSELSELLVAEDIDLASYEHGY